MVMRGLGAAFAQDLRPAARGLLRAPLFTGTALLVLALAIGAATAVFSLVDAVVGTARALPAVDGRACFSRAASRHREQRWRWPPRRRRTARHRQIPSSRCAKPC